MTLQIALLTWAALRTGVVKPRTRKYHQELIQFIGRNWPEKFTARVLEISETDLGLFILRIAFLSDSRFNGLQTMLHAVLPAANKLRRRRLRIKERSQISQLEFSKLLVELDSRPRSRAGLVIRFLAHTGLRINEARKLRWRDVRENRILVPGSVSKNGRPRVIPFVNGIVDVLVDLRELTGDKEMILPQAHCQKSLRRACRRVGLPRLSHHSFRHHFATRCIESGVDLPTVARWLGHTDGGALLARTYFHLVDEHSRAMAAKVKI